MQIVFLSREDMRIISVHEDNVELSGNGYSLNFIVKIPNSTIQQFKNAIVYTYPETCEAVSIPVTGIFLEKDIYTRLSTENNLVWNRVGTEEWLSVREWDKKHQYQGQNLTDEDISILENDQISLSVKAVIVGEKILDTISSNPENQTVVNIRRV